MRGWLLRRALQAVATLAVAIVLLFVLMRAAPGDPLFRLSADRPISQKEIEVLRARYGLDQPVGRQLLRLRRGTGRAAIWASRSSMAGRSLHCWPSGCRPPSCSAAASSCSTSPWGCGWASGRRCAGAHEKTGGSPRSRSPVTRCPPSGSAWCSRGWWASNGGCYRRRECRIPLLSSDAGVLARAADVLRHLVLPVVTLSVVSIAATMRYQRAAMLEVLRLPYIVTARAKGLSRAGGHLAACLAQRALSRHYPLRSLASDPGDRIGVRRGGVRLAGPGIAGRGRGGEPRLSPADGRVTAGGRSGGCGRHF